MNLININIIKYFHMIPLWKSPIKLPVELPVELPAVKLGSGATRCGPKHELRPHIQQQHSAATGVLHRCPPQGSLGNPRKPWILRYFFIFEVFSELLVKY